MSTSNSNIIRLSEIDEQERKLVIERTLALKKAFQSEDVDTIYKAQKYYNQYLDRNKPSDNKGGMKSMIIDPFEAASSMGYYSKGSPVSYEVMRTMARSPITRAVLNTRKDQVAEFAKPQENKYSKGFVLEKIGVTDDEELSDRDKKIRDKLTEFLLHCGDDATRWDLDDFETFVRKIVEDSLTMDAGVFENIYNRGGEITQFVAVDGASFRIADSYDNDNNVNGSKKVKGYYPSYVQLHQGNIHAEFYPWELCYGTRNPSTNIYSNGYGRSELEDLVTTITAMLNADKYNYGFFRHGSAPKGMLLVKKGNMNPNTVAEFASNWNATLAGVGNHHKTPILDAESFEWLDLQKNNRDMEFSKYQEYLIKLHCAVYKISPEEIGFPLEGQGGGGLGGNDSGKEEKQYSKDKGLKPLLTTMAGWLNKFVVGPKTNYTWQIKFVGIDSETAVAEEERLIKAATVYMTPDEVRKIKGMKPLPNKLGIIPLNPIISQMFQSNQQNQMQAQQDQQEKDEQGQQNQSPFLDNGQDDSGTDDNPFMKSFNDFLERKIINK